MINARLLGNSNISYEFRVHTIGVHNNENEFTPIKDQVLQLNLNSNCQPNWTITDSIPFQNLYQSSGNITTDGFVLIGEDQQVEYKANRVTLNSGFSIKVGEDSRFKAGYGNCD